MSYTSPTLDEILANEELMNTRLTDLRTLLRSTLDELDISYTSSNTVIELIRLLDKDYYCNIDGDATVSDVSSAFAEHVLIRNVTSFEDEPGISFYQYSAAPDFSFSYHPISESSGMVTAVSLLSNKTAFEAYDSFSIDYDMTAPSLVNNEVNRGMCVLFNDSSPVPGASTYYGFCAGITVLSRQLYAFIGKWSNSLTPTYSYSETTLSAGDACHFNINGNSGTFTLTVTDDNDDTVISEIYDFYDESFYRGGYAARVGTYADWYAYEGTLYGAVMPMKNIVIDY